MNRDKQSGLRSQKQ